MAADLAGMKPPVSLARALTREEKELSLPHMRHEIRDRSRRIGQHNPRVVKPAIDIRVARHDLHVLACLGERNRVHEFGSLAIRLPCRPKCHSVFSGIVRGQRPLGAAKLFFQSR